MPASLLTLLLVTLPGAAPETPQEDAGVCALAAELRSLDHGRLQAIIDSSHTARNRREPQLHVRGALARLQLGTPSADRVLLVTALEYFDRAERHYSDDPCFYYFRALNHREVGTVKVRPGEVRPRSVRGDDAERATRDLQRASELRPDWLPPAVAMADLTISAFEGRVGRRGRWREQAFAALDGYLQTGGEDAEAFLWRGRLLLDVDSLEAALTALADCRTRATSGMAELETARALFALGRADEAMQYYWRAVDSLSDSTVVSEFTRDLHYILDRGEEARWQELESAAERATFVQRFWERRSARDLIPVAERLQEHYSRLHFARREFRRLRWARANPQNDLFALPDDATLDHRGLIYILLGEPEEEVNCTEPDLARRARVAGLCRAWVYASDAGQPITLPFSTSGGVSDWYLTSLLPQEVYERLGTIDPAFYTYGWRMWLYSGRYDLDNLAGAPGTDDAGLDLADAVWADPLSRLETFRIERTRIETVADEITVADRMRLPLDYNLEFGFEWLFFRATRTGGVEATLSYAIPNGLLSCRPDEGYAPCDLQVRASIFQRDSLLDWEDFEARARVSSDPDRWLFGHLSLLAAPGSWDYRVAVFESPDSVAGRLLHGNWAGGQFVVPALRRSQGSALPTISSLVLALPGRGSWRRGGEELALNPLHVYPPGATVELYYEIYDLPEDVNFTTEIMLLRDSQPPLVTLDPPAEWISEELAQNRPDLQLSFEESGWRDGAPWLVRRKTLSLTDIRSGDYVLVLAVTPPGDAGTVYRLTPLRVDERVR